jgi:hypothetical protein
MEKKIYYYNKLDLESIKTGDILLVGSNSFLSKAIKFFQKNKYSHAGIFIRLYDELFICESLKRGIALTHCEDYFNHLSKYNLKVLRYKKFNEMSTDEQKRIEKKIAKIMLPKCGNVPYDYISLLFYEPIRFIFKKWIGGNAKNSDKRFMCAEWCAYVYNKIYNIYGNWFEIAPVDIEKDTENFETIEIIKI